LADSTIVRFGGKTCGVEIGDIDMARNNGKMKVILVFLFLLTTVAFSHIPLDSRFSSIFIKATNIGIPSQTYTDHAAIFIDGNADFIAQASSESWDGTGTEIDPIIIEGYRITGVATEGIKIWNVNLHWIVRNCKIENAPTACGFYIDNCSNGEFSNNIIQDRDVGIQCYQGTYNCSFLDNQILNNQDTAFKVLGGMADCIISGNSFADNLGNNFWITGGFNDSHIVDNTIIGGMNAIRVTICIRSSITGNSVSGSDLDALVFPSATGILISGNTITTIVGNGIMTSGDNALIESNTVSDTTLAGIFLAFGDNGTVTRNLLSNCSEYGLKLGGAASNTTVKENSFIDNIGESSQIIDDGENNFISYNHYSDWTAPDGDSNGIVDAAYSIDGESGNEDPYPIVDPAGTIPTALSGGSSIPLESMIVGIGVAVILVAVLIVLFRRR